MFGAYHLYDLNVTMQH